VQNLVKIIGAFKVGAGGIQWAIDDQQWVDKISMSVSTPIRVRPYAPMRCFVE
jgi:hypothetical protein